MDYTEQQVIAILEQIYYDHNIDIAYSGDKEKYLMEYL